jgi:hypothetical protein
LPWLPSLPPLPPLPSSSSSSSFAVASNSSASSVFIAPVTAPRPAAPRVREGGGWVLHGCYLLSADGVWLFSGWTDCQGKLLHTFAVPVGLTAEKFTTAVPRAGDGDNGKQAPAGGQAANWGAATRAVWEQACSLLLLSGPSHSSAREDAPSHDEPPSSIVIASMGAKTLTPLESQAWRSVFATVGFMGGEASEDGFRSKSPPLSGGVSALVPPVIVLALSIDESLQLFPSPDVCGSAVAASGSTTALEEQAWLTLLPASCLQSIGCDTATHTPSVPSAGVSWPQILGSGCLVTSLPHQLSQASCSPDNQRGSGQFQHHRPIFCPPDPSSILSPAMPASASGTIPSDAACKNAQVLQQKISAERMVFRTLVVSICLEHRPGEGPADMGSSTAAGAFPGSSTDRLRRQSVVGSILRQYHALAWLSNSSSGRTTAEGAAALPLHAVAAGRLQELVAIFGRVP